MSSRAKRLAADNAVGRRSKREDMLLEQASRTLLAKIRGQHAIVALSALDKAAARQREFA